MAGKTALNPFATPYVPRSSVLAGGSREEEKKVTQKALKDSEKGQTAESRAPVTDSVYNIHSTDYAGTAEKSGSEMAQHVGAPGTETLPDEAVDTEAHGVMDDRVTKKALKDSEKEQTAESQAPVTDSVYNIHSTDYAGTAEKSGSEMAQHVGAPGVATLPDEAVETEAHGVMDDRAVTVDYLCSLFPDLCEEFLADVLHSHDGDLGGAIEMLEAFEVQDVGATIDTLEAFEEESFDPEGFPELSGAVHDLYFPSPERSYRDESSPRKKS